MNTESGRENDLLQFVRESDPPKESAELPAKKKTLLIVDDEKEIHAMTKLVLADYFFEGASLNFLSAYSGQEAREILEAHPDIACILLDVVMETQNAGLEVARFIRQELKNDKVRIILRTGQPGKAPEKEIILNYDINDYKEKTELTTQKLFTVITTALRSYNHLVELDNKNIEISKKNDRLNQEIARRIVVESKLKKYNKSLEKLIDSKSRQLQEAIQSLTDTRKRLQEQKAAADIASVSSISADRIEESNHRLKQNIDLIDQYRTDLDALLRKYETLSRLISTHMEKNPDNEFTPGKTLSQIDEFRTRVNFDAMVRRYTGIIKDSQKGIDAIASTVSDMKTFLSISHESKTDGDIQAILKNALKRVQKESRKPVDVQLNLTEVPVIRVAVQNIENAFYEIIKNAFNAVGSHGIVSIACTAENKRIIVSISDLGKGIAKTDLTRLFSLYAAENGTNGSRGVGLCFARSVVSVHNGEIQIESVKGQGTTVIVELDISE